MEFKMADVGVLSYIGDPMCSWCWGITPHLERLQEYYKPQLKFETILGGLRPGGGEEWNDRMKAMLRDHWEHVQDYSGQPFNFDLLSSKEFNYDTEPSCRAVRVVRELAPQAEYSFFKEIQYKFYVKNEDPTGIGFYQSICENLEISYQKFSDLFLSEEYKKLVVEDFIHSRKLGVTSFPTVILRIDNREKLITNGYSDFESMRLKVEEVLRIPLHLLS